MRGKGRSTSLLLLLLILGVVLGGIIGELLSDKVPFLSYSYPIGLKNPVHLDLSVIDLTFGLIIDINVASAVGFLLAFLMYRRL
jgi:uncharacterized protein DUF4321